MHYDYELPDILQHILHTMKAVIELSDDIDSATPESQMIRDTYSELNQRLLYVIDQMVKPTIQADPMPDLRDMARDIKL